MHVVFTSCEHVNKTTFDFKVAGVLDFRIKYKNMITLKYNSYKIDFLKKVYNRKPVVTLKKCCCFLIS